MSSYFIVDNLLTSPDICNLEEDTKTLVQLLSQGEHVVFYGRRNMGKTSLINAKVVPELKAKKEVTLSIFADFLGVQSEEEVATKFKNALQQGLIEAFPTQTKLKNITTQILNLRPAVQFENLTGELQLSLESKKKSPINIEAIFLEIKNLCKKNKLILIFDEFQDINNIPGLDAKFRGALQSLPPKLPVLIMGSKKHLLAKLFTLPNAPLAGWGIDHEISQISANEFLPYMNARFKHFQKQISLASVQYLTEAMQNIPESINYVCKTLCTANTGNTKIEISDIELAIKKTIQQKRGRYEESLQVFTVNERNFLKQIAILEPVKSPTAKDFLAEVKASSAGVLKILKKLEDLAIVYKTKEGWVHSDPLLARYMREFW